eukprot:CAMPEP_0172615184 /NCGR_PEP_ID=MMETSP1068-20121228/56335_1 /TAXON_ID=35684 /ORGANISM="Pseudopedinella elastica, Strain CCMP716" /LENGTH=50 /DNA_ID=CAMNT_0013420241 /DNA_START=60 /DNA_END=209 /DNA_ORIENTATION=-
MGGRRPQRPQQLKNQRGGVADWVREVEAPLGPLATHSPFRFQALATPALG